MLIRDIFSHIFSFILRSCNTGFLCKPKYMALKGQTRVVNSVPIIPIKSLFGIDFLAIEK